MFDHVINIPPMGDDTMDRLARKISNDELMISRIKYMADGNIGAINVIAEMYEDPILGSLCLGMLMAFEIKGSMLWLLYKDVNGQDVKKMMSMIQDDDKALVALEALPYAHYKRPKK